ncbi:MAG: DUF58 domain-containing protein [Caldisericaceae bacterium]
MRLKHQYSRAKLTGLGWSYLLLVFLVSGVAVNSGNNLIYLTLSTLISYFLLSGFLSLTNMRGIEVELTLPYLIFANSTSQLLVTLNNKSRFSKFLIRIESPYFKEEFFSVNPACFIKRRTSANFIKRGALAIDSIYAKSAYPFSFFERRTKVDVADSRLVVFPEIHNVRILNLINFGFETPTPFKGNDEELFSIRDYVSSDDRRKIAWKLSAKSGVEKVIEGSRDSKKSVTFFIETSRLAYSDEDDFEIAVSKIASAIWLCYQSEIDFTLLSPQEQFEDPDRYKCLISSLTYLANVKMIATPPSIKPFGTVDYEDVQFTSQ